MAIDSPIAADVELPPVARQTSLPRPRLRLSKKLLFAIHGWLGLSLGLPLFIICFSGSLAVVSHEIDWLLTPALRAPSHHGPVNWGAVAEHVRQRYPDGRLTLLSAPVGQGFAAQAWVDTPNGRRRVFADPASGQVTGETGWFNTQRFFRDFHRRFFWMSAWGITLVSAFSVILLMSVGTGLLFYKRWWAKLLTLRLHKGPRVFWSDLHRMTGVWTLLFAGVIAVTGFWYLIERPATRLINARESQRENTATNSAEASAPAKTGTKEPPQGGGETATAKSSRELLAAQGPIRRPLPIDEYVRIASDAYPTMTVRMIWLPTDADDPVRLEGQADALLVRDRANRLLIDPYSGAVRSLQRAEQLSPGQRWIETADPLHFGDFGGLTSKLIWFVFGLLLSALMPTGVYLWLKRAEQTAIGVVKQLDGRPGTDLVREVRRRTRRRTGIGLIATTAILVWAAITTCEALARQQSRPVSESAVSPPLTVGPWTVTLSRDEPLDPDATRATIALRFDLRSGVPNYRRASLAISETQPIDNWQRVRNNSGAGKAALTLPASMSGRERLWVAVEGWDGVVHHGGIAWDALTPANRPPLVQEPPLAALGGTGVVAVCAGFTLLCLGVSLVWYGTVWGLWPQRRILRRMGTRERVPHAAS